MSQFMKNINTRLLKLISSALPRTRLDLRQRGAEGGEAGFSPAVGQCRLIIIIPRTRRPEQMKKLDFLMEIDPGPSLIGSPVY